MKLTDRINELFNKFNVNLKTEEINLEAQAVLENGTVVYTDADSFVEGADVFVLNEEGERIPLPDGDYTFEDGSSLKIADGGKVAKASASASDSEGGEGSKANPSKGGKKPAAKKQPVDPKKPTLPPSKPKAKKSAQDKLAEEDEESNVNIDVEVDEKDKEEMMDDAYVIDLINKVLDERFPAEVVEAEEIVEEEEKKEEIEMSEVEKLRKEITELKTQAASKGVERVKKQEANYQPVDLTSLSNDERITALFNQFNK